MHHEMKVTPIKNLFERCEFPNCASPASNEVEYEIPGVEANKLKVRRTCAYHTIEVIKEAMLKNE